MHACRYCFTGIKATPAQDTNSERTDHTLGKGSVKTK